MDWCRSLTLCLSLCIALPAAGEDRQQAEAELQAVRERIKVLQTELAGERKRRSRAERDLKKVEQAEQKARQELQGLRKESAAAASRREELTRQEQQQQEAVDGQQEALAAQVRMAYINGDVEWLRVVLSQQDTAQLGRRMAYYGYLSRQRQDAIAGLRDALAEITAIREQISQEITRLAALEAEAADKLEGLANTRAKRAGIVTRIREGMDTRGDQIAALKTQEAELGQLISELAKRLPAMPDVDAEPFAGQTAKLQWPVDGPLLKRFGQPRADGSLKWNGVLLGAGAGSEVKAVYHGRVVFADWLAGMGLLTIVEHDNGYMSLYGHNQDLVKDVGEWVIPGEVIAHVGDSGGQANAGLYFEIRKDGEPVNPQNWVK
jgi:septal ring factor EnvC (AmiA/AmiB activator)